MIRCVIFDFDGTLVDSNAIKRQAFLNVAARQGQELLMEEILETQPGDRYAIFSKFATACTAANLVGSRHLAVQLASEYTHYCEEAIAVCPELEGASEMLDQLKRENLKLALNSATPTDALAAIVSRRGWQGYFSHVLGGPFSKAENLAHIVDDLHLKHQEVVMVGDRRADQNGAAEFGCPFIGVICADSDFDPMPQYSVNTLAHLPTVLRHLQG